MKTSYFANCIGVFEGGGVRGAAFAGAFQAARAAGIGFSQVAGTSAGAIVAAFIASGATPEVIARCLEKLDFEAFKRPKQPENGIQEPGALVRAFEPVFGVARRLFNWEIVPTALTVARYAGLYSSEHIENWIEEQLRQILQSLGLPAPGPYVRFADLPIPLTVIASDISRREHALWSSQTTAAFSVAAAVRASCSIPFYFQPKIVGASVLVDGGLLSNLPNFPFGNGSDLDTSKYSTRLLNFRLEQTAPPDTNPLASPISFVNAIRDTVVDGATKIQNLQSRQYPIKIDTGDIGSTDFSKIDELTRKTLFEAGQKAVRDFVSTEKLSVRPKAPTTYVGRDQRMSLLTQTLSATKKTILFFDLSCEWVYLLFPSFLAAINRGVHVVYVTREEPRGNADARGNELYGRQLLRGLGATIEFSEELPFIGFVVDPDQGGPVALTSLKRRSFQVEMTRIYSVREDPQVFEGIQRQILKLLKRLKGFVPVPVSFSLGPCHANTVIARLRRIPQYTRASFELATIELHESVQSIQAHVKEFKYQQIHNLVTDFSASGIDLFSPREVRLNGGITTIITPPVLERHGNSLVFLEGNTRAFYCLRNEIRRIQAIVVSNVDEALPATPRPLVQLTISDRTIGMEEQFPGIDFERVRAIEKYVHPNDEFPDERWPN